MLLYVLSSTLNAYEIIGKAVYPKCLLQRHKAVKMMPQKKNYVFFNQLHVPHAAVTLIHCNNHPPNQPVAQSTYQSQRPFVFPRAKQLLHGRIKFCPSEWLIELASKKPIPQLQNMERDSPNRTIKNSIPCKTEGAENRYALSQK